MSEKKIGVIDYFVILVKWKRVIIPVLFFTMLFSYLTIYFFVDEEFESSALVMPSKSEDVGGLLNAVQGLANLPVDLGGGIGNEDIKLYFTILNSRTVLEDIIEKFDLINVYEIDSTLLDYKERAIKTLSNNIKAKETDEGAFEITVSSDDPQRSSDMTNYILKVLNNKIITLEITKSANNRKFLEERLKEIKDQLRRSEDSLSHYQKQSGILSAEEQIKGIVESYTNLETQLITKEIQQSVLEKILSEGSPQLQNIKLEVSEFKKRLEKIKKEGQPDSYLLPVNSLPDKAINYFRLLRDVEINQSMLQFVLPLYEKAKFDEQKDLPVFQILDTAIPHLKKSYPPRTIFTLIITFGVFLIMFFTILLKENDNWDKSEKLIFIRKNLFSWKTVE
ncbi:MAG: Wzz/FepE/Etk N-terminal domain-containing protein [Ignavibacteria bacterium]|jgi:uncharacterized protein involved in exopolysaccharide biosynthesis